MTFFPRSADRKNSERSKRRKNSIIRIYTGVSPYSDSAFQELEPSDITLDDILSRHQHLIKAFEHKKAETLIQEGTSKGTQAKTTSFTGKAWPCPFKQKKYRRLLKHS